MSEEKPPAAEDDAAIESQSESDQLRPDPMFKEYTAEQARKVGLEFRNVELPQLSLNDLVLAVPDKLDLTETMFDFFGKVNIVEFKSENDPLTLRKLAFNQARAWLMFAKGEVDKLEDLMSVVICAQYPQTVVELLQREAHDFRAEEEWLLRCRLGGIEIAIVVCRLLPIERKYYWWLMFAPAGSKKWQSFVTMLLEEGEGEVIEQIRRLRPKEYKKVLTSLVEDFKSRSQAEQAEYIQDLVEIIEIELGAIEDMNPQLAREFIAKKAANLTPEQRLAGLEPEQIAAGLSVEEREKLLELLSQPAKEAQ